MARVIWTPAALAGLASYTTYIAEQNSQAARKLADRLLNAGDSLTDFPSRGRPASHGRRELATLAPYILVYRVEADLVLIEHLRHSARR